MFLSSLSSYIKMGWEKDILGGNHEKLATSEVKARTVNIFLSRPSNVCLTQRTSVLKDSASQGIFALSIKSCRQLVAEIQQICVWNVRLIKILCELEL